MKQPKLHVITDIFGLTLALDKLLEASFTAYDSETTGLHHGCMVVGFSFCFNETDAYYIVLDKWDKNTNSLQPVLRGSTAVIQILEILKNKDLIMHNGIFDCSVAEQFFKISLIGSLHTDTMLLAHTTNENRRIGLKELAKEYFGESATVEAEEMRASVIQNGGVWSAKNKEMYKADCHTLGKYGAKDAWLTYMLFWPLAEELYEQGLDDFFYISESMPLLRGPTYELNTTGLKVDLERLAALKQALTAESLEAKNFIYTEIAAHVKGKYPGTNKSNAFNIGSSQQLAWLLFGEMELEFNTLTDGGKQIAKYFDIKPYGKAQKSYFIHECLSRLGEVYQPEATVNGKKVRAKLIKEPWCYIQADKKALGKYKDKYKWVSKLLEYQRKIKILNTYVKGVEQRIQYGIIRPSFLQTGTTSGRYSSRNPNLQNLPRDDKRVKACFVARPGKVFVGADYSQLEPRVFAYYSKDERLLNVFKGEDDFYSVIGMEVYGKTDCTPRKEGSPEAFGIKYKGLRDLAKIIALAPTYGATAHQLAPTTGKSIEDTQQDIDNYFETFPGVRQYQLDSHEIAKETGQVTNLFGRPRRMPEAKRITEIFGNAEHSELPYEARNILNLAVNHPIQSTGASIINRAMIAFHHSAKSAEIDCKIVSQVHDSLVVECQAIDAETVVLLLQHVMENTVDLKTVRLEAIPKCGLDLSKV